MSIQSTGHGGMHRLQPVHQSASTVCMRFEAPMMASTGQAWMHLVQPMQSSSTISATTAVLTRKATAESQQTFSLGEEDRGRFKDTEPSIIQGEDLDVPTWMRLKKKLRR